MPWFRIAGPTPQEPRVWTHWKWTGGGPHHDPETQDGTGRRDIASVQYPLIGPYDSSDRKVIQYHLRTAKAAGITAFLCIWYGPHSGTDQQIPTLLDEAQKLGMRIAICYEEKLNFPAYRTPASRADVVASTVADLSYIVQHYGAHPAYLKRNGLPFIYQFNGWGQGPLGPRYLTPQEWSQVFAALPGQFVYGRQNLDPAFHPPIGAAYLWFSANPERMQSFARQAAAMVSNHQLQFWMSMVSPGFDDTGVWGWGNKPRVTPRHDLDTLKLTFDSAFGGDPELIQIVTWNDFNEDTVVEPTREEGFADLDALETWWGARTGRPVDLSDNRTPFLDYAAAASPREKAELPPGSLQPFLAVRLVPSDKEK